MRHIIANKIKNGLKIVGVEDEYLKTLNIEKAAEDKSSIRDKKRYD